MRTIACGAALAVASLAPSRGAFSADATPAAGAGEPVLKIGDRVVTRAELQAQLEYEPAPILDRMRDDENFGRIFAVRWYETELFAKAAADDGVLAKKPGLAGAAQNLGRNLIADEYVKYVLEEEFKPSETEIKTYYTMNAKERCTQPARYHLARLGVQIAKNASEAETSGANARLAKMQERLKTEPFATVADEMSDLPAKGAGGDVGWIADDELGKEEGVGVIRALAVGKTSDPIRTLRGLEIFKMVEKQEAKTLTLDECRPKIVSQINAEYRRSSTRRRTDELAKRYSASLNLDAFLAAARSAKGQDVPASPAGGQQGTGDAP
ncbi:MAG TPA: peptidylprolyl isomerase [Candidatus Binatia bacterium]|nr:peptidylprolyl isomerase [Candidatus Binatia bacterium]